MKKLNVLLRRPMMGRKGFSLLEVILSIAILGGALVVIGQLVGLGYKHAMNARLRSDGNIILDTKMAEVAAGVLPLESVSGGSIEENTDWAYSVFIEQSEQIGLLSVTVNVRHIDQAGIPVSLDVTRFMPDPDYDPAENEE